MRMPQRRRSGGHVVERGSTPGGHAYRVWECHYTGKRFVYVDTPKGERRRNTKWLRKMKKRREDGGE